MSRRSAALLLLLLLAACARGERPNVLVVTFDTTRWDRFGCTGDPEARTPVVDALAAEGTLFEHAYSSVALTLPAHTTIFSGLEPPFHGVHNNGRYVVPDEVDTLAERLARAGYETAAFVSAFVLHARFNLDQGFAVYRDETRPESGPLAFTVPTRPGAEVTDQALEWLAQRSGDAPFFLWAHYYDPHLPRDVEPPFDAIPDRYRAEIAYADAQLGRLLEGARRAAGRRPLLIVFTADHGESLGEHGEDTHGIVAYDSTLHVPLIVAGPGFEAGARRHRLARHVDIVPTVLGATGVAATDQLPGRSLRADAGADDEDLVGYFESRGPSIDFGWSVIEGVRAGRWKYTAAPAPEELYDVVADPRERDNRAAAATEVRARMERLWRDHVAARPRPVAEKPPEAPADVAERLAALGYVEAPSAPTEGPPPDPRRMVTAFGWVEAARSAAMQGHYEEAVEALETLRQGPSLAPLVLRTLAEVYAVRGHVDDAARTYRAYIALTGAAEAKMRLVRLYVQADRPGDALAALDEAGERSPGTETLRAFALGQLGRHVEARAVLDDAFPGEAARATRLRQRSALVLEVAPIDDGEQELRGLVAVDPDDRTLQSRLGYYLAIWGSVDQRAEALALLSAAAAAEPDDAELQGNLGWGAHAAGDESQATAALERSLEIDSGRDLDRFRLALVLRRRGDTERARELLRTSLARWPGARWAGEARETLQQIEEEDERTVAVRERKPLPAAQSPPR